MKNVTERHISKAEQAAKNLEAWINQFDTPGMIEMIGSAKENPAHYRAEAVLAVVLKLFLPEITAKLGEHFNRN